MSFVCISNDLESLELARPPQLVSALWGEQGGALVPCLVGGGGSQGCMYMVGVEDGERRVKWGSNLCET